MSFIEIKDASKGFGSPGNRTEVLKGINLTVKEGEFVVIVGYSGSGKSTLINLISGLVKPDTGTASIEGQGISGPGPDRGLVFQNYSLLPWLTVTENIALAVDEVFKDWTTEQRKEHVAKYIAMVKLTPAAHKLPKELSGGMRQRIVIAMALACRPDLIIADEPTTALDVTVQAQILDLIKQQQEELGMAMILITHDLGVIAETCDEVVVMYGGRIVERAPVKTIFENPRHAYTKGLLNSMPHLDTPRKSILPVIPGMVASLNQFVHGCRFCQRLGRSHLAPRERPIFAEVSPQHWVETCPLCYQS